MQNINVIFTEEDDKVMVTLEYNIDSIPPEIVIQALYDLAKSEEVSWKRWQEMYLRRN